jgi:hypothetical protein
MKDKNEGIQVFPSSPCYCVSVLVFKVNVEFCQN